MNQCLKAELAERSPIIIQNSSNPSSRKNLDVRPYYRTTLRPYKVLLLTCVVNCTAGKPTPRLCSVISALVSESDDLGSSPGRGKALCPWDVRAPLLGLAKSIYYQWQHIMLTGILLSWIKAFMWIQEINLKAKIESRALNRVTIWPHWS